MMNFLAWIIFGLVAGAIAKFLLPGKDPGGWLITILIGVAGSFVGGFIGSLVFEQGVGGGNEFSIANMGLAVVGAVLLLLLFRMFKKNSGSGPAA